MLLIIGICGSLVMIWQLVLSANSILLAARGSEVQECLVNEQTTEIFPIAVTDTFLIAQYPVSYEGPYMEDGSHEYVAEVAALVLFNTARTGLEEACVVLKWDEGEYVFVARDLPPRAAVMVLDNARQKFQQHIWTDCVGSQRVGEGEWMHPQAILVKAVDQTRICVENISDRPASRIRIYYKSYLLHDDIYIGGITYCVGVEKLEAGDSIIIEPYRYVKDYARVVRIQYDS